VTDHLLVRNVAPTATLGVPALTGVTRPTAAQLTIADAGANDSFSCWIDWGDGTGSFQGTPSNGACAGTHLYSLVGPHWVVAHVLDDDGGFANSNEVLVVVKAPPTIGPGSAPASAKEGESFSVSSVLDGASDVSWSATGGTGACTFASPTSAATSVDGDDNGDRPGRERRSDAHARDDRLRHERHGFGLCRGRGDKRLARLLDHLG
jgi:hypothetical protein